MSSGSYYRFTCKDVDSDSGRVEIVIMETTLARAWDTVRREVVTKGRPDLLMQLYAEELMPLDGVIFSNVESGYEPSGSKP